MTTVTTRKDGGVARREPYVDLTDFGSLVNRLFGETSMHSLFRLGDSSIPGADLVETDDGFTVEIELPGLAKKDITIDVTGRRIAVHGERKEQERGGVLRHSTRTTGRFDYELMLPSAIDEDSVKAALVDGVLTVTLPKSKTERPKHVPVT